MLWRGHYRRVHGHSANVVKFFTRDLSRIVRVDKSLQSFILQRGMLVTSVSDVSYRFLKIRSPSFAHNENEFLHSTLYNLWYTLIFHLSVLVWWWFLDFLAYNSISLRWSECCQVNTRITLLSYRMTENTSGSPIRSFWLTTMDLMDCCISTIARLVFKWLTTDLTSFKLLEVIIWLLPYCLSVSILVHQV
jgi:hypothetical protein